MTEAVEADETAVPAETGSDASKPKEKVNWLAELRGLVLMLLAVMAFHSLVAKPFYIPSESMLPNLRVGDRLVVSKYPYGWSWVSVSFPFHILPRANWRIAPGVPEYGDIVIAVPPDKAEDYIKRVIGLPGDTIAVVDGRVILNGKLVPRSVEPPVQIPVDANDPCNPFEYPGALVRLPSGKDMCELESYRETLPNGASYTIIDHLNQPLDNYPLTKVPEGYVFLMGDNRDHSADSRAPSGLDGGNGLGGPVPLSSVGGRAEFITFSLNGTMTWNPMTWIPAFRGGRAGTSLRPPIAKGAQEQ